MWNVLQNPKVDLILDTIWSGPYEYDMFQTDYSMMSRIVSPYLLGKKKYFNHIPFNQDAVPQLKVNNFSQNLIPDLLRNFVC
jgi:hypothetical protein